MVNSQAAALSAKRKQVELLSFWLGKKNGGVACLFLLLGTHLKKVGRLIHETGGIQLKFVKIQLYKQLTQLNSNDYKKKQQTKFVRFCSHWFSLPAVAS